MLCLPGNVTPRLGSYCPTSSSPLSFPTSHLSLFSYILIPNLFRMGSSHRSRSSYRLPVLSSTSAPHPAAWQSWTGGVRMVELNWRRGTGGARPSLAKRCWRNEAGRTKQAERSWCRCKLPGARQAKRNWTGGTRQADRKTKINQGTHSGYNKDVVFF